MPLWPSWLFSTTSTTPAASAAVDAVNVVLTATATFYTLSLHDALPISAAKPVPVTVTAVPPLLVPELGEIALTVGAGKAKGQPPVSVPVSHAVLGTTTNTTPAQWAAGVAVSEGLLTTVTLVSALPPRLT